MSLSDQWSPTSAQVTVLQARGLRIKGKNGTNDAYAVMQLGKEKFQTSVAEKSVAPVWKEEASFDMPPAHQGNTEKGTLHVHVLHRALVGPDKLLGQAVINLLQLSEDKSRDKTQWFKLLDKAGKPDKDRGELLLDVQFTRNNMTASMFDISTAGKSRSRLGKLKDKVKGKKKEDNLPETSPTPFSQVVTDSEGEGDSGGEETGKEKKKKSKAKSLFSHKTNLQKNLSQSMSVLPRKNSSLSGSVSSGLNVEASEGKKKFKFLGHKRTASSDKKELKLAAEQSNLCINGSHIYCEDPAPRTSRASSNFSLASSGVGSMEDVPDSSPPSVGSRGSVRRSSPWTEEEETIEENTPAADDETIRRRELERLAEEESRLEEEERRRMDEEIKRERDKARTEREEEEKRAAEILRVEAERRRLEEEEERIRMIEDEEKERVQKEEEERIRLEDERKRLEEEEKKRAADILRVDEERKRQEEEMRMEAERRRLEEEQRRKDERIRLEEERKRLEEQAAELLRVEEERKRQEEEVKMETERRRLAEEEQRRMEDEERERALKEEQERIRLEDERKRLEEQAAEVLRVEEERKRQEEEARMEAERRRLEKEEEEEQRRMDEEQERALKAEEERKRLEEQAAEVLRVEEERKRQEEEVRMEMERRRLEEEEEQRRREEEERIRLEDERKRLEEEVKQRKAEEEMRRETERKKLEREDELKKLEEERLAEEERQRQEELERSKEALRIQWEQEEERRMEEERKRHEEEEKMRLEMEKKRLLEEEERLRKEREEQRREEEKRRQWEQEQEQERIRQEEAMRLEKERAEELKRRREEERLRAEQRRQEEKEEEESRKREEASERERSAEEERRQEEKRRNAETVTAEEDRGHRKTTPNVTSTNPFDESDEDNPHEDNALETTGRVTSAADQRRKLTVNRNAFVDADTAREKRQAPKPPRTNQSENQQTAQSQPPVIQQSKDVKTASVLPQRTVKKIHATAPSSHINSNNQPGHFPPRSARRPAPQRPASSEEERLFPNDSPVKSKQTVSNLNPFEDGEDVEELADASSPALQQSAGKDTVSSVKSKSSKAAHAPAPPTVTTNTPSTDPGQVGTIPDIKEEQDCGNIQTVQEEAKKDGPPVPSRRLHPVKPLNPQELNPAAQEEKTVKPTGEITTGEREDVKYTGPYALLTQAELISLVLKQESQLLEKSKKISELEQYIDNLLVRVMEEAPSVLMTMAALK